MTRLLMIPTSGRGSSNGEVAGESARAFRGRGDGDGGGRAENDLATTPVTNH
jgi:hypothetical protein